MGYTTDFYGEIEVDPPLNEHEVSYLKDFANTRRMKRHNGPLYVKGSGFKGQGSDADITDYNTPPAGQPGLWCQWVPSENGKAIAWDFGEKFYRAAEWMAFIVDLLSRKRTPEELLEMVKQDERFAHFSFDHVLNGQIEAQGEDPDDKWRLYVENNEVSTAYAELTLGPRRPVK